MPWSDVDPSYAAQTYADRIMEHASRRPHLGLAPPAYALPPPLQTAWDSDPNRDPPAVILPDRPHDERPGPSSRPDRRSARYRDGQGPPPPLPPVITERDVLAVAAALGIDPTSPDVLTQLDRAARDGLIPSVEEAAQALARARYQEKRARAHSLVPQGLFDRPDPVSRSPIPATSPATAPTPQPGPLAPHPPPAPPEERPRMTQPQIPAQIPAPSTPPGVSTPLSKSQKRRARRAKSLVPPRELSPGPTNGYAPVYPSQPSPRVSRPVSCPGRLQLTLPDELSPASPYTLTVHCPLAPWPHPGQPHLVELPAGWAEEASAPSPPRVFVGWYTDSPGEDRAP